MSDKPRTSKNEDVDWVVPAEIPFEHLKAKDLEECLFWLFDAMGAKNLEWRSGGTGGGAADGGRDLEAHFYSPSDPSGEDHQVWWVECKGRAKTVDSDEVKSAVNNSLAFEQVDHLLIATNSQFSNPTIDWVKEWQKKHPHPKIHLWDHAELERRLSRHPDAVSRLFSSALSLSGKLKALEQRFWNKLEYVPSATLAELWVSRLDLDVSPAEAFSLIANEFSSGDISKRPWGVQFDAEALAHILFLGVVNIGYFAHRATKTGAEQMPIIRACAYLVLCALDGMSAENVKQIIDLGSSQGADSELPDESWDILIGPICNQLQSEIQDVCSADCARIICTRRDDLTADSDEISSYWARLNSQAIPKKAEPDKHLIIESYNAPCKVGFEVSKDVSCPLFEVESTSSSLLLLLETIQKVAGYRKAGSERSRDGNG